MYKVVAFQRQGMRKTRSAEGHGMLLHYMIFSEEPLHVAVKLMMEDIPHCCFRLSQSQSTL